MNADLLTRAPTAVVARNLADAAKRRNLERADAWDFLVFGDEDGRHAATCAHALAGGEACTRAYDPLPDPEALPADLRMYDGTGVGALYGLAGSEDHLWQLAGWNVVRRTQA